MSSCNYCNKLFEQEEDILFINDCGEAYCYSEIKTKEDIDNSCIGKELLKCHYSYETILEIFNSDLDERELEIFYTTAE